MLNLLGVFIFGLLIGSFINVVIYRLPVMLSQKKDDQAEVTKPFNLCFPRSHCVHCETALRWFDLIPVFSFLFLRGGCRVCKARIAWQYPVVELVCALIWSAAYWQYGLVVSGLAIGFLNSVLLALFVIDAQHQLLPDALTLLGVWSGLLFAVYGGLVSLNESVLACALAYLLLRIIADLYRWLRKQDGLGGGDMKLMALMGAWFGFQCFAILSLGAVLALVFAILLLLTRRLHWQQRIAFGPFLIFSAWIWLFLLSVNGLDAVSQVLNSLGF